MDGSTLAILIVAAAVAVSVFILYKRKKQEYKPEKAKAPTKPGVLRDIPVRKATEKINVPAVVPIPVNAAPPLTPGRLDRLFVDGEEVDSHVDPERNLVIQTALSPLTVTRGKKYVLKLTVQAEPLADPADRKKLKDALRRPGQHTVFLGAHELRVVAWPYNVEGILMSNPQWEQVGKDMQIHMEEVSASQQHFKLYFYGDDPMAVEIEIPFNITQSEIPEWAWTAFKFQWRARRLPGNTANETEWAVKDVRIVPE